jgi:hypothetical protein
MTTGRVQKRASARSPNVVLDAPFALCALSFQLGFSLSNLVKGRRALHKFLYGE